jgi:uncharacterized membrane protein
LSGEEDVRSYADRTRWPGTKPTHGLAAAKEPEGRKGKSVKPVDVVTSCIIDRPRAQVAAFCSDPENAPRWYVNIKSVELKSPRPLGTGSRMAFVAHFLGRRLSYAYEVTQYVSGVMLVMRTAEGPFPMETTYTWEAIDENRTRMSLRNQGNPAGYSLLMAPFMSVAIRKANRKDLARLKAILEQPP